MNILDKMPKRFLELTRASIQLGWDSNNVPYIDVMTGMKSHLHLYYDDGQYIARMRYDEVRTIEDFEDFFFALRGCMCYRDYMSSQWVEIHNEGFGEFSRDKFE